MFVVAKISCWDEAHKKESYGIQQQKETSGTENPHYIAHCPRKPELLSSGIDWLDFAVLHL